MLGIILIVFIGKHFFKLAESYNKNKWLYGILGVISYYAGSVIGGIILGVLDEILGLGINWENNFLMIIFALIFGLSSAYLFRYLLKRSFEQSKPEPAPSINDIGKNLEEEEEESNFRI